MLCFAAALFSRRLLELWLSRLAQKRNRTSRPFAVSTFNFGAIYAHLRSLSFTSTLGLAACQILILPCDNVTCTEFFPKKTSQSPAAGVYLAFFSLWRALETFTAQFGIGSLINSFGHWCANTCLRYSFDTEFEDGSYVSGGKFFKLAPYQPCALSSASILALALFAVEIV